MKETYLEMVNRHQKEVNDFPIAFAFNEEQLYKALAKLGAKIEECTSIFGNGDIIRKSDVKRFMDLLKSQHDDIQKAMKDEEFAEEAFLYEMDNHEYAINSCGDEDVLDCFDLTLDVLVDIGLNKAYMKARTRHIKKFYQWD